MITGILPVIGIQLTGRTTNAIIAGGGATISGFAFYGIEVESSGAIVSELNADNNAYGIELNQAHGVQLTNIEASNNSIDGLNLTDSSDNQISAFTGTSNGYAGILIVGPSDANRVSAFQANSNRCGVAIASTSCGSSRGIRVGCIRHSGRGNVLTGGEANGNSIYGISMDEPGSSEIIDNTATMNGTFDLIDAASDCAHNLWFGNTFATSSPSACIH